MTVTLPQTHGYGAAWSGDIRLGGRRAHVGAMMSLDPHDPYIRLSAVRAGSFEQTRITGDGAGTLFGERITARLERDVDPRDETVGLIVEIGGTP